MSYGYGLSASLFQMAHSYTVFAHDGEIIPATMLKSGGPGRRRAVFSAETAPAVRTMLQMAAGPGGTGPQAQTIGYSVGGKSGTAHKQVGKGYAEQQVPLLVHRHGADRQAAHHRRRDDRRAAAPASTSAATSPRRCSATSCSRRCA